MRAGVVIPFYQREAGPLRRALQSVFQQSRPGGDDVRVVVVDDRSPIPPGPELEGLEVPAGFALTVLQAAENGGPGGARNLGLDLLAADPPAMVAFLDSDDVWTPDHLERAAAALEEPCDFYFENHIPIFDTNTFFAADALITDWLVGGSDPPMEPEPDRLRIFRVRTDRRVELFIRRYMAHTSTVAYRFDRIGDLRFQTLLRSAGEDQLFWIELAGRARSVRFSDVVGCECGRGVNVYYAHLTWDDPGVLRRVGGQLLFWLTVRQTVKLSPAERRLVAEQIRRNERWLAYLRVRALARRLPMDQHILSVLRDRYGWGSRRLVTAFASAAAVRLSGRLRVDANI